MGAAGTPKGVEESWGIDGAARFMISGDKARRVMNYSVCKGGALQRVAQEIYSKLIFFLTELNFATQYAKS